jgi:protein-tyrosine-phosphatase
LVRRSCGPQVEVCSAGSHPKALHPHAIQVMKEYGIDLSGQEPKHLSTLSDQHFDWVISLCDRVREVCPDFPGHPATIHWSIPDPAAEASEAESGYEAFQRTAAELKNRIGFFLAVLHTARS